MKIINMLATISAVVMFAFMAYMLAVSFEMLPALGASIDIAIFKLVIISGVLMVPKLLTYVAEYL